MRNQLRSLLRMADLCQEEVTIYLWLLRLRQSSIPELRKHTRFPNITVYRTVNKLLERGLVESVPVNHKQSLYRPLSLRDLTRKVASKQRALRRLELELSHLDGYLPYLNLQEESEEAEIELRIGQEAFREEYLKFPDLHHREYLHIGNMANFWKTAGFHYESPEERSFIQKRLRRNIYGRVLDVPTPESQRVQEFDSREKRTLIIKKHLPIMRDFLLIGEEQVSHFICDSDFPRVIVMRSPTLLTVHRDFFEMQWNAR